MRHFSTCVRQIKIGKLANLLKKMLYEPLKLKQET